MSQRDLVPEALGPSPFSSGILGVILGVGIITVFVIVDAAIFPQQTLALNVAIFTAEAEVGVAAGILLEVWLHWVELVARRQPHADPPSLALTIHASPGDLEPAPYGPILAVTNFGPGIARDLTLEWFGYPMTEPAKAHPDLPVTSGSTIGRPALTVGEQRRWNVVIPPTADIELEYMLELQAYDLLGVPLPRIQYQVSRFRPTLRDLSGTPAWAWQIRLDRLGRPITPSTTIAELRQRGQTAGPPRFWPLV